MQRQLTVFAADRHAPGGTLLSRRQWLVGTGGWGVLAVFGGGLSSYAVCAQAAGLALAPGQAAWRAMSRLGYGPTPALAAALAAQGSPQQWALQQIDAARAASALPPLLAPDLQEFAAPLPGIFAAFEQERTLVKQRNAAKSTPQPNQPIVPDPARVALQRMDFSLPEPTLLTLRLVQQAAAWRLGSCSQPELENPLLARLTEFWFNHLNVSVNKGPVRPLVGHYLVHAIRANALGKFEDLLLASARHPAMLLYLDLAQSVGEQATQKLGRRGRGLNENYARELMELHTLGVNGGYTQADVRELARLLTGWTVDRSANSGFRFAAKQHDGASVRVLGRSFASSGEAEGVEVLRMLARHPATAQRVCRRLAQFFVADKPSAALVGSLAQTFLATQGDISAVLQTLFSSTDFWDPANRLFKTPLDYACSALAATQSAADGNRRGWVLAGNFLVGAGQPLHAWPTPDGYSFDAATWLAQDALTRRADFALNLGRQLHEINHLKPYLSAATQDTISQEPAGLRAGLALASPDFMYK